LDLIKATESLTFTYSCTRPLPTDGVGTSLPIPASGQTLIDPVAATEPFLFYRAVSVP